MIDRLYRGSDRSVLYRPDFWSSGRRTRNCGDTELGNAVRLDNRARCGSSIGLGDVTGCEVGGRHGFLHRFGRLGKFGSFRTLGFAGFPDPEQSTEEARFLYRLFLSPLHTDVISMRTVRLP